MHLPTTHSTSSLIREQYFDREDGFCIRADFQSAGRGQTGNGWSSRPGENLLFSILLRDHAIAPEDAFLLNIIPSLAIFNAINRQPVLPHPTLLSGPPKSLLFGESGGNGRPMAAGQPAIATHLPNATIKWPNDLYLGDRKVCGILVENFLRGDHIDRSIVGIGLNVNQTDWPDSLPNPISLREATGISFDIDALYNRIVAEIAHQFRRYHAGEDLWADYLAHLYRREGYHLYAERPVDLSPTMISRCEATAFEARIEGITPRGELILSRRDGTRSTYHFKQIRFIIPSLPH